MSQIIPTPPVAVVKTAPRRGVVRKVLSSPVGIISLATLLLILLITAFAPLLAPQDPTQSSLSDIFAPTSADHPLGGDSAGRDLLSRLLYGAQVSLLGATIALVTSLVIGLPTGLIAGYYGRAFDSAASWASNLIQALPAIVVLLALRTVVGPSIWVSMVVFGVMLSPGAYRLVRATVSGVRNELYVDAARVSGLSDITIITRHVLPVVKGPLILHSAIVLAISIDIQAGLEFLGFGDTATASWGSMLNEGFLNIFQAPQMLFWPGLALALTSGSLALFAGSLRDALQAGSPKPARKRWARSAHPIAPARPGSDEDATSANGLLTVRDLRVAYGGGATEVVHGVSIEIARGEVLGLVGESGSGKTQVALSILGLLPQGGEISSGTILLDGEPLVGRPLSFLRTVRGKRIGYIPQEPMSNLDPSFKVGFQLSEVVRVHLGMSRSEARQRVLDLLAHVGIPDPVRTYNSYPHEISGGMAQRVLIAGAVSCDPELLIADEPTTALDVTVQADILDLLRGLQQEKDLGVLLVTHNFGVVADICDRVLVMSQGEIVEAGDATTIFEAPKHNYTKTLLGSMLDGRPSRVARTTPNLEETNA
ncbi:peptide/nickel transport system permease protein [Pseudarthrobacter siccitolerans]|uniref:Peptide/nickel transport system permease protein n=1 Tax=Pseudarthrobacter siccitolerans TaxID=861266 RepID=A0ABU0PMJ3_9MICC|nr:dipeptide/oligopeptide/nickel ABC transporter permease/ATP-binding protein [Pseudarthrobacter siccitolerans]MDQ0675188.1 peptide/nickel transport system permease protein [Pseudarthrobacter siccitolerans]